MIGFRVINPKEWKLTLYDVVKSRGRKDNSHLIVANLPSTRLTPKSPSARYFAIEKITPIKEKEKEEER
jgi:hypothetical protein